VARFDDDDRKANRLQLAVFVSIGSDPDAVRRQITERETAR
jgi:hypothetical protein